ncbi:TCP-1/cpn60 chaperonin family protein [Thermoanaerobacterium sp. DL9XJH110]|uniref:TCP-1/cpn60 chaperonin family protein n=1 Tax=Thermoanaerobacterium sp. DL9XJH110 TaxID=3386643 RepID=UPI003BB65AF2
MAFKDGNNQEVDERLAALITNSNAIRAVASAVEGTIGPKGLDIMLVDRFGEVTITNDGVTILKQMDVNHPAAKMLINIARAQQEEVGDGTTTATIMAGTLVSEGVNQILKGVPVARVIEGIKYGVKRAQEILESKIIPVKDINDPALKSVALIAGREHEDIAELVTQAAKLIGEEKLKEKNFKLKNTVMARAGAENEVFMGIIIDREKMNKQMPGEINDVRVLLIDDALEAEEIAPEALRTEAGFNRYLQLKEEFRKNLQKLIDLGVNLILVDKNVSDEAEEILTDAGVIVLERVSRTDLEKVSEHTGARIIKRIGLKKPIEDIKNYIGRAERVYEDEKLEQIRIVGGKGKPMATILVGAATEEIVGERERIAKDAASSLQAAVRHGMVPGGGSIEIAISREMEKERDKIKGMASYGIDCVIAALKRPLGQIVYNSGFNPLEKIEEVIYTQAQKDSCSIGINCDNGELADMLELGVLDPALVKLHAIKAAGEVAEAILRIDTIIKKRDEGAPIQKTGQDATGGVGEMDF